MAVHPVGLVRGPVFFGRNGECGDRWWKHPPPFPQPPQVRGQCNLLPPARVGQAGDYANGCDVDDLLTFVKVILLCKGEDVIACEQFCVVM